MLNAPAAERNKVPIKDIILKYIDPSPKKLLEVASGTGQHASFVASHFPNVTVLPSDISISFIESINAYRAKFKEPIYLDVSVPIGECILPHDFRCGQIDIVLNINMIHISSNAAVDGLFTAADALLKKNSGMIMTYGPYALNGELSPESNVNFDSNLRTQCAEWGVRDIADLEVKAVSNGFNLTAVHDMPSNNKMLIFQRNS